MQVIPLANPQCKTETIKAEALRLGFLAVGITSAHSLKNREADLSAWLRAGSAGPLHYMEAFFERQACFLSDFSDLKSIIVLAVSYARHSNPNRPHEPSGRIARYAAGRNYHRVLVNRLKRLESFIRAEAAAGNSVRIRRAVDTSPIQERVLAEAAGLGFFGKNTCLIRPRGGSFFFLSALLTNLELQADQPIRWDCGGCTLCIEACPTDALRKPYHLDANRCISSLTIEAKGPTEAGLRPHLQDWLFGCDICQEVCPYNKRIAADQPPIWPELDTSAGLGIHHPLASVLSLRTQEAFLQTFSGTSLTRPGREGLLRNAAIVAGNLKNPGPIPQLSDSLFNDSSTMVRQHAAWALGRIGTETAQSALNHALTTEKNQAVICEIRAALGQT